MPADPIVVITPEEKRRREWDALQAKNVEWQEQQKAVGNKPCPECGGYKGYNPITGVHLMTHFGREDVEGHRDNCPRNILPKAKK